MDMKLKAGGREAVGLLVAPSRSEYNIEVVAPGKLDRLVYSTCAREDYQDEAWDDGWFDSKYKAHFKYRPNPKIEKDNCDMYLAGYEKIKGRHSEGLIVYEEEQYKLPARIVCQGREKYAAGVSGCETKAGIMSQIEFDQEVKGKSLCAKLETEDNKIFRMVHPRGECAVGFIDSSKRKHKLILKGYDQIPLRSD